MTDFGHFSVPNELPFIVDVAGCFSRERVRVAAIDTPRPTTAALEFLIAEEWTRQLEAAASANRMLFNGPLLRHVAHETRADADGDMHFDLIVGPTCYRDFVGTNLFNKHRLGEFEWSMFANPVGTTATIITADNLICYGLRSARVSYHALHVHTFGGSLEAGDRRPDGRVDPFASVAREIVEELNVRPEELRDLVCAGLIRDREIHQPEMLFEAKIDLTAADLRERWKAAESKDEHDDLVTLPNEPDAVLPFVRSCGLIAPVAVGALFLHGRLRWGEKWFEQACRDYAT